MGVAAFECRFSLGFLTNHTNFGSQPGQAARAGSQGSQPGQPARAASQGSQPGQPVLVQSRRGAAEAPCGGLCTVDSPPPSLAVGPCCRVFFAHTGDCSSSKMLREEVFNSYRKRPRKSFLNFPKAEASLYLSQDIRIAISCPSTIMVVRSPRSLQSFGDEP